MKDILTQLQRVAYVMFKDGWQSKETAGLAFLEITSLRAEITRLQKELETAREDALEEAAAIFDARNDKITELMEREYHQVVKDSCVSAILRNATDAAAIRALKDKEVAG